MSNAALILSQLGAPFNPVQSMGRAAALRNLQNRNQLEQQDMQFNQAKLDEIARANQDRNSIQSAAAGAYQTPAPVTPQMPPVNIGGTTLPGVPSSTVQGPAQFDRNAFSQALPPQLRMQADSQFAAEDRQKQSDAIKQQLDQIGLHEKLMQIDKQQRDLLGGYAQNMGQIYGAVLQADPATRPQLFSQLVQNAKTSRQVADDTPEQYPGDQAAQASFTAVTHITDQLKAAHEKDVLNKPRVPVPGVDVPLSPAVEAQKLRISQAGKASTGGDATQPDITAVDPASGSILAQTGLSLPAFMALTGKSSQLSRDKETRKKANEEAQKWANKNGVDISTLPAQYASVNKVLGNNIERMNNTKIMENELEGTIQNLRQVANDKDLGKLKFVNVAKIWAGQEVNDDLAQQYAMHLNQLRNELSAYNAATQGRTGGSITVQDTMEAERTIKNGISAGSLNGLETAVKNSTEKMGKVMQNSVDAAQKSVWELFGVGKNFKAKGGGSTGGGPAVGTVEGGYKFNGGDPSDQKNWTKQ